MPIAHLTKRQVDLIDTVLGPVGTVVLRSLRGSEASHTSLEVALEASRRGMSVTIAADSLGTYTFYERAFALREQEDGLSFIAIQSAADLRLLLEDADFEDDSLFSGPMPWIVAGDALERPFVAKEVAGVHSDLLIVDGGPRSMKRTEVVNELLRHARRYLILLAPTDSLPAFASEAVQLEWGTEAKHKPATLEFRLDEGELGLITSSVLLLAKFDLVDLGTDPTRPSLYEGLALLQEGLVSTMDPFEQSAQLPISQLVCAEAQKLQADFESLGSDPRLGVLVRALSNAPRPIAVISRAPSDANALTAVLQELLTGERVWRASSRISGPPPFDVVVCCDLDIEDELVRQGFHSVWWDSPEDDLREWYSGAGCIGAIQLVAEQQTALSTAISQRKD